MLASDYDNNPIPHMPKIVIDFVDHNEQRYETCGDFWWDENGVLQIKISKTNAKQEFLVAIHEAIEASLCMFKGINEKDVTEHDLEFEKMRKEYPRLVGNDEPGDNKSACYLHEHAMASRVERWLGDSIGVNWDSFEKDISGLEKS